MLNKKHTLMKVFILVTVIKINIYLVKEINDIEISIDIH